MTEIQRSVLPIPEVVPPGLTSYDAADPNSSFPPIVPLRPPEGAPNVLVILIDDLGIRRVERVRGPVRGAECGASRGRWTEIHAVPHHRVVCTDSSGVVDGTESSQCEHGCDYGGRDLGAGAVVGAPGYGGDAGRDL